MQCPRCGLQNAAGAPLCARCALPFTGPGGPVGPSGPTQQSPYAIQPGSGQPPHGQHPTQGSHPQPPPYGGYGHPGQSGQPSSPHSPNQYGPPGQPTQPPQPNYGGYQPPYQTAPWGAASQSSARPAGTSTLALILLAVGALLGLGYAAWALTVRRGVFTGLADGNAVSLDDAKSSDTIDTIFLVIAGLIVLAALVVWLLRKGEGRTGGGALELGGLAAAAVGVALALVGLIMLGTVGSDGSRTDLGDKAATATLLAGVGFAVQAIGLLLGLFTVKSGGSRPPSAQQPGYQNW